jgi:TolA-binding protein
MNEEILALLEEERGAPGLTSGARDRLRSRLEASLPLAAVGVGLAVGALAAGTQRAALEGAAAKVSSLGLVARLFASKAALSALMFTAGTGVGVGAVTVMNASRAVSAPVNEGAARAQPSAVSSFASVGTPAASVAAPPGSESGVSGVRPDDLPRVAVPESNTVAAAQPAPSASERSESLRKERSLLEAARTALTRRDFGAAREALATHSSSFPKSQFQEERESLMVQALAGAGDMPAARARAARFREQFPNSMFKNAVDRAAPPISVTDSP